MTPQGNWQIQKVECSTEKLVKSFQLINFMETKQAERGDSWLRDIINAYIAIHSGSNKVAIKKK